MAHWVEEDQVFDAVTTSSCNGDDVMEVKICRCSVEHLFTHGTSPFLLLEDSLRASEGFIEALQECTLLKVHLPFEVVWVGVIHNLDVSLDVYIRGFEEVVDNFLALAIHTFACKHPASVFESTPVPLLNPSFPFVFVQSNCPCPKRLKDFMVNLFKGFAAYHAAVVERPASDFGIEQAN